ncbi:radical SAM family heme chaperone HemW [Patiriisocius sp. Uisw_017]|uniref:radical SAM family heme chaperone HemW n=1 Tax=Patiriisocius sp. Uisw_017 TaxID=3230968 RepID=UPI0039E7E2B0
MAGIYIHIPFCKQACHYCDFHFSTSLKKRDAMVAAICKELLLRKQELTQTIETIYFGGGTPSLLAPQEIDLILETVYKNFTVSDTPEITLEANPDDLTDATVTSLASSQINRLSIGIQSFFEEDLKLMNRAHNETEALQCIIKAKQSFKNISIDLMYGIPQMSSKQWQENIEMALSLGVPHISCYVLTVEPKTALERFIKKGIIQPIEDAIAQEHHSILLEKTEAVGYHNYEFSNFCIPGWESQSNSSYWKRKPYLGVGPSAHSYDIVSRNWNISNNALYIKSIEAGNLPLEREILTKEDQYNEYVMTRLRTASGISLLEILEIFGTQFHDYIMKHMQQHLKMHLLFEDGDQVKVTKKGKFLTDGISSDLFMLPQ